jgi:hypothetical protein
LAKHWVFYPHRFLRIGGDAHFPQIIRGRDMVTAMKFARARTQRSYAHAVMRLILKSAHHVAASTKKIIAKRARYK